MYYVLRVGIIIVFSLFALFAQAQNSTDFDEDEFDCENELPITTVELRYCMNISYEKVDNELNELYQKLVADLKQKDSERLPLLREAQRSWIKFRDDWCRYEDSSFEGGTAQPLINLGCREKLTQLQIQYLRDSWID